MSKDYAKVDVSLIVVERSARQRRVLGPVQDLADSIKRVGLINPITITRSNLLIAGERRLEACKLLSEDYKIPCRYLDQLDPLELQLLELEENIKRSELSWQDQCKAVAALHNILLAKDPSWTQDKTAEYIGFAQSYISDSFSLSSALSNERIASASDAAQARGIIKREAQRAVDNELNNLMEIDLPPETVKPKSKIFQEDFLAWSQNYSGPKFNFIHCDFPYGIDHQKSEQGNIASGNFAAYGDTKEVYWNLVSTLCSATEKLTLPSSHLMFWFSMKFYQQTIDFFHKSSSWELSDEKPLIWMKSDNKGIVSDITRRPRNIYETALVFSKGDRKIITPVSNAYACPTSKSFHASEKPEPMLRHFFRMFVDGYSEVLDPTCGSGTAVRAAFNLGARRSIGLELDPEFASSADGELTRTKAMKQLEIENDNSD